VIVVMVMIVVVVMIAVMVAVVAPSSCIFQVAAAALRLTAVFPVLAFRILQLALGIVDLLFALSVVIVIAVKRPCGNRSAQKRQNNKGGNECSGSLEHASSSACIYILLLDALAGST
jgi:hypothetical protein